ncbi:unnamed protein product [Eruca vesicaria subsp. sativa]|uniref:Uncharacterized protein n=1 Tax=Eruca vesicaria subsp. sativa TaxID=29727 RepID=A0ABC8J0R5_ERUVS|nr:unnamed protein product [Eruca vesicaria subsp. sativa]
MGSSYILYNRIRSTVLEVSIEVFAEIPSASDVIESFPGDGFFRARYDSCQYIAYPTGGLKVTGIL